MNYYRLQVCEMGTWVDWGYNVFSVYSRDAHLFFGLAELADNQRLVRISYSDAKRADFIKHLVIMESKLPLLA